MDIILKNKLPKNSYLSQDIIARASGYIKIQLHGNYYYIPITKEAKKLFKISKKGNKFLFPSYKAERRLEAFLMDFIQIMYLQVRDEVGSEIHQSLSQELSHGFQTLFSQYLEKRIENGFNQKQISLDKEK